MHRVGDFVLACDPMFNNEGEWDLFRVERNDSGKETLSWQMSITSKEMQQLMALMSQALG